MGIHKRLIPTAALAVSLLVIPRAAAAQEPAPARRTLVTINPLGIPFEYFSGEFERVFTGLVSVGATLSYLGAIDDASYGTAEWKLRFYPNEEAPKGFSVGMSAGLTRVTGDEFDSSGGVERTSETRPTLGVIVDYNWILGRTRRFVVGTGVGAKRIFGLDDDFIDANIGYPTARFQVGFLF